MNIIAGAMLEQARTIMSFNQIVQQERMMKKLLDLYYGEPGSEQRQTYERAYKDFASNSMARVLDAIHTHAEIAHDQNAEQRVYREKDIVELLDRLGYPVDWKDGLPL
jgi:hypothetical protein